MRPRAALALACAAVTLLAGCGPDAGPTAPSTGEEGTPEELIDLWRVDAAGEPVDTWLRLDVGEFQLWRGGRMIHGSWAATERTLLASTYGFAGEAENGMAVEWLNGVLTYEQSDEGWRLIGEDDEPIARLSIDGGPQPVGTVAEFYTEPPVLTDELRRKLRAPEPLPDDVTPAADDRLAGRWVPAEGSFPTDPHVTLEPDGTWTGSDGCNRSGSRWTAADNGRLLTTEAPSTDMGCDGAPVPMWLTQAERAGIDGQTLVLYAQDGSELGRLRRA